MNHQRKTIQKPVLAAMFAALTCVSTMVIHIPAPTGFVNAGDAVVLLAGLCLGPVYGSISAGLGAALADLLLGYGMYVPGTFAIKALVALLASLLLLVYYRLGKEPTVLALLVCTVPAEILMVLGYFGYETLVLQVGAGASAAIPANLMQGLLGVIASVVLFRLLHKVPVLRERFWKG